VYTKCDQCTTAYGERNPPEDPPCDTCWVDLRPDNKEAAEVYIMCRDQIIVAGMGQVIGINNLAIYGAMDRFPGGVKDQWRCLNKVRAAFQHFRKDWEGDS
jgi:hypothetical protein